MCSALLLSSCESVLISDENVSWCHLLEGGGNVLIAAIDELAARDVIRDLLRLPQLPGQWPLPCRDHHKGERINILPLGRVVNCQVLSHRVSLVIGPDLLLVRVYPCMGRETSFPPVPPGADGADPGIICPGSENNCLLLLK